MPVLLSLQLETSPWDRPKKAKLTRTLYYWETHREFPRWQCSSIRLAVVASKTCQLAQNSEKIWTYSSSRSSKVNDFCTNRKRIYDFLLVINSNFDPILHRFWDTATYWLKIAYFSYSYSAPPFPIFPLEFHGAVKRQETRVMGLLCGEGCVILASTVFDWSTRVTDRQTDGRWHIARYSICCRALKTENIQSGPKKWYPSFNFAITSVNIHRF